MTENPGRETRLSFGRDVIQLPASWRLKPEEGYTVFEHSLQDGRYRIDTAADGQTTGHRLSTLPLQ